jgi:phosphoribosylformylglycinamidine synthase
MSNQTPLQIALAHSMTKKEYETVIKMLGREPNYTEIGIISAMWSEHCSYKSSAKYLRGFPTTAPWVIQGPGENAGVIDIGDGYAAVFKMESHNHPSFIEPYQGAATGVGGIMRDIFTMGARPVASMNLIQFANIQGNNDIAKKHRYLLRDVVKGIGGYGNCMGVPTIGGQTGFEECYAGNNLVNAFCLGICKSDEIFLGIAEGIGNPVMYVGSKTGRDGLGGAVMSSASFTEDSKSKRPTVQVGDPFTEKLLLEACMELFKADLIIGIQDMGAAGLTSSSFEMAGRTGSGMKINLNSVPAREEGMTPYDFMLSESQERMLICAKKGCEQAVIDIFDKWELSVAVIGEVTDTGNMELYWHDKLCANIPIQPLSEESPVLHRPIKKPEYLKTIKDIRFEKEISTSDAFDILWASIENIDKSFIYEQYDSTVQRNTIKGPNTLDGSTIRIKETKKALTMSTDCNTRFCYINPELGAASAVMEAGRNVVMSGAIPKAITDCLNFGNPEDPEVMWQLKYSCEGIKSACKALNTPVIGGNVSLYNETNGVGIFPTPAIATVGINEDINNVLGGSFKNKGNFIYVLGETYTDEFGGSLYLKEIEGKIAGTHPRVNFNAEANLWDIIINANNAKLIECAKDVNTGGLALALAKMCAVSGIGAKVNFPTVNDLDMFAESLSRAIVEITNQNIQAFEAICHELNVPFVCIGLTCNDVLDMNETVVKNVKKLQNIYFNKFKTIINQDI